MLSAPKSEKIDQQEIVAGSGGLRETLSGGPRLRMQNHLWCNSCDTPMWLVLIEPDETNRDRRTFECPRCQDVTVVIVDIAPEETK